MRIASGFSKTRICSMLPSDQTRDIRIVEKAFKDYNKKELKLDSGHYKSIERTFNKVGQNPWSDDMAEFERHIMELSEDLMYRHLLENQKALQCQQ